MEEVGDKARCEHCPGRTPFRPDPENLARAKELQFEPALDEGIREIVIMLIAKAWKPLNHARADQAILFRSQQSALRAGTRKD
jgi:hypothetical protein